MLFNRLTALVCGIAISAAAASRAIEPKVKFGDIKPEDFKPAFCDIDSSADAVPIFIRKIFILILFILIASLTRGQDKTDFKFGNITVQEFDVSRYKIVDQNTSGIILYDAGSTHFIGNNKGWFSYVYTRTRRIKILDKNAFSLATVEIELYTRDNDAEVLSNVKATTYNLSNGTVISASQNKNDIFTEQEDKNHILTRFTLPSVQEGSIIEYTYKITSNYIFNIPSWSFQSIDYPTLWSEYEVSIPGSLNYIYLPQGKDSFYIKKKWENKETYRVTNPADKTILGAQDQELSITTLTSNARWVKKDMPPFRLENYVSSLNNYVDKIEFQLYSTYNGQETKPVMNTWQAACEDFLKESDFEQAVSYDNTWIKDLDNFTDGESSLEVAKKIYHHIQNNFTCTDSSNLFKYEDLHNVYKKQGGSVRGLNLLLIAMLHSKGIDAKPVLLSTREHGFVNANYPIIDKFNYLICEARINNSTFLLDASNPILAFGKLSNKCYNGYARVVDRNQPDSFYLLTDSLRETRVSTLFLNNDEAGKISGSYKCVMGEMQSAEIREKMRKSDPDEYFKDIKKAFSTDLNISNAAIDSLKQLEMPVSVQYEFTFKLEGDIVYFNPVMSPNMQKENPFKAAQRFYPVEMPYCIDETYVLSMDIPTGYKVDELPKPAKVTLNENEGMFEYLIQQSGDHIQLRCRTKLNRATFDPDDYETLRNFFAFVVQKQSEQIVFKKM